MTYANNYWQNISSRTPSVRFGTVHVVNSFYDSLLLTGINARQGAQSAAPAPDDGGAQSASDGGSDDDGSYASQQDRRSDQGYRGVRD